MKTLQYEQTPITVKGMRTKNMRKLELNTVENFSDWALISVPVRELWRRHSAYFWVAGFWLFLFLSIWQRINRG